MTADFKKKHPKKRSFTFMDSRDMSYFKPEQYRDHLTLSEVADVVRCDISWIRKLERRGRIPKASRVRRGKLLIRLWSPEQVEEIKTIISQHKVGRPKST